jgi:hypothetical protein
MAVGPIVFRDILISVVPAGVRVTSPTLRYRWRRSHPRQSYICEVEELVEEHSKDLTTEDFEEIKKLNRERDKEDKECSSEEEQDSNKEGRMPTGEIKKNTALLGRVSVFGYKVASQKS